MDFLILLTRAAEDHHVAGDDGGDNDSMVVEGDAVDVPLWGTFRTRSSRKIPRQVSRDSSLVC